jgi:trans-AT polyketide synthase/acyltransferase/oxidoreductase domain-containing protein
VPLSASFAVTAVLPLKNPSPSSLPCWLPGPTAPAFDARAISNAVQAVRTTAHVLRAPDGRIGVGLDGTLTQHAEAESLPVLGFLPPLYPEWLGDRSFAETHHTRFPYVAGAMANGIASTQLVVAMAEGGCLGFFGAAGLSLARVGAAIEALQRTLDPRQLPWGVNLIHSPAEAALEDAVADLLLQKQVRCVEASAYLQLTPAIVRYACSGLHVDADGAIRRRNRVFAKVSRSEVARQFLEPPPAAMLKALCDRGQLSELEAQLAAQLPLTEDLTAEADSGGHTDNRALTALLPALATLRDRIASERGYRDPIRLGAAGGIGTPAAVAAAFAMGAAYVQTGSVNQACIESGLDASARRMLAEAEMADVIMAPAADMFEMGVNVQVLRRGSMFAPRARKLYELYRGYPSLEAIPADERQKIERDLLRASFDDAWVATRTFWMNRDPAQAQRAEIDPKHRMALVFRAYLGLSSRWAIDGVRERAADFQIWCGPAMGAFNTWVHGSFLADPAQRGVVQVARNLLEGAAVVTRAQQLRSYGVPVPAAAFDFRPRPLG